MVDRRTALKVLGTACVAGLAGCSGGGGGDGSDGGDGGDGSDGSGNGDGGSATASPGGTIEIITDAGGATDFMKSRVSAFESQSDYTVELQPVPKGAALMEEVQKRVAAGNPPDIMFRPDYDVLRMAKDGVLEPINEVVESRNLRDTVNVDGNSYLATAFQYPLINWYRNDLYGEDNPGSFSNWLSEAEEITNSQNINGYGQPSGSITHSDNMVYVQLRAAGVDIYDGPPDDLEVVIDKGENRSRAISAFQFIQDINEYSPNANGWAHGDALNALQQESVASTPALSGLPLLTINENRPDFVDNFSPGFFPTPDDLSPQRHYAIFEGHVVRSDGDTTKGAKEYLNFFYEGDRHMEYILQAPLLQWPAKEEQFSHPDLVNNDLVSQFDFLREFVLENMDLWQTRARVADNNQPSEIPGNVVLQLPYGSAAERLLIGNQSPEEAIDSLGQNIRSIAQEV